MALRAKLLLNNWLPALHRATLSTSPVIRSGYSQMSRDASTFFQHMKRDGMLFVSLVTGLSIFGYMRYNVSVLGITQNPSLSTR